MAEEFAELSKGSIGALEGYLNKQDDFTCSSMNAIEKENFRTLNGHYPYRIEDVPPEIVYRFVKNQMYAARSYNKNSEKADRNAYRTAKALIDDDGDAIPEGDLLVKEETYTTHQYLAWKEKVPYIIKRLHEVSKEKEISLISILIAYVKAKSTMSENSVGKRHVYPYTLKMDWTGHFLRNSSTGKILTAENKGAFLWAYDWVTGMFPDDRLYKEAIELLMICDVLNINLKIEDPTIYEEEFIDNMIVLYVTKNKDYVGKRINNKRLKQLKNLCIDDYDKDDSEITVDLTPSHESLINDKILQFNSTSNSEISIYRDTLVQENEIEEFLLYYRSIVTTEIPQIKSLIVIKGFYAHRSGKPLEIDITPILANRYGIKDRRCLIHTSGLLVLVHGEYDIWYTTIEMAKEYLIRLIKEGRKQNYSVKTIGVSSMMLQNFITDDYRGTGFYGKWNVVGS